MKIWLLVSSHDGNSAFIVDIYREFFKRRNAQRHRDLWLMSNWTRPSAGGRLISMASCLVFGTDWGRRSCRRGVWDTGGRQSPEHPTSISLPLRVERLITEAAVDLEHRVMGHGDEAGWWHPGTGRTTATTHRRNSFYRRCLERNSDNWVHSPPFEELQSMIESCQLWNRPHTSQYRQCSQNG